MTKTKHPVLFIILDAFRSDYINPEDTPFLWSCAGQGVYGRRLVSSSGFTQRSAILSGAPADIHGSYTMFCYDPKGSPWAFLRRASGLMRLLEEPRWAKSRPLHFARHHFRHRVLYKMAARHAAHAPSAHIPLSLLSLLSVTEDVVPIYSPGALGVESIFDILRSEGKSFRYLMFPDVSGDDERVLECALGAAAGPEDFFLVQFSDSDAGCHKHGTSSPSRREIAGELDRKVKAVFEAYQTERPGIRLLVIGDHGMMDVSERLDVAGVVHSQAHKCGLVHGVDYLLFLDSTLARMWYFSPEARARLATVWETFGLQSAGELVTPELARRYRVPPPSRRYGETIWMANPGVLISPDYFHAPGETVRGMHGYDSHHPDMMGFAILHSPDHDRRELEEVKLLDICPTLCDLLEIRYPARNEGTSMLRRKAA